MYKYSGQYLEIFRIQKRNTFFYVDLPMCEFIFSDDHLWSIFGEYPSLPAFHLSGTPVWRPVLDPLAAYTSTTVYISSFSNDALLL